MTEKDKQTAKKLWSQRQTEVKDQIKLLQETKEKYERLLSEIKSYEEIEIVKRYIKLKKQIEKFLFANSDISSERQYNQVRRDLEEPSQFLEGSFGSITRKQHFSKCTHPIWSYISSEGFNHGFIKVENEESPYFSHNLYMCLECSKLVQVKLEEIETFEKENKVLKSYPPHNINTVKKAYFDLVLSDIEANQMPDEIIRKFTPKGE